MSDLPLVSAIIATYNRAHIVEEAIESILHQTYANVELIVIDDGSVDNTREVLDRYAGRIKSVYQENAGPAAAWNRGIQESRGEIITFLGSDDIWLPTFLQNQVAVLQEAGEAVPCCLCNGWLRYGTGKGTTSFEYSLLNSELPRGVWTNVKEVLSTRFVAFGQMVAIRRSVLERIGLFDKDLRYLEDYDMALRLAVEGPWGFIREPLVVWRQGTTDSLSQEGAQKRIQLIGIWIRVRERVLQSLPAGDKFFAMRKLLGRTLSHTYGERRAVELSQRGNVAAALLGRVLLFAGRVRGFIFRRSRAFPQMMVASLPAVPSTHSVNETLVAHTAAVS